MASDIEAIKSETSTTTPSACYVPERVTSDYVPTRSQAHFDLMFAALACNKIGVGGIMFGSSSPHWRYPWLNLSPSIPNSGHDEVYHRAGSQREHFIKMARWNWGELAKFATRLKNTPDGTGNMLDNTLI